MNIKKDKDGSKVTRSSVPTQALTHDMDAHSIGRRH